MSTTSALTVQAIADKNGIVLSKPNLSQILAQEAEDLIQQYIRSACLLATNSRSHRLSAQHINRVLISEQSMNRILSSDHHQCLFGYEFCPIGQYTPIPFEQSELFLPRELDANLIDVVRADIHPLPAKQSFKFEFLLVEGVHADKKLLSNRRLIVKAPKLLERSVSAPLNTIQQSQPPVELVRHAPINLVNKTYDQNVIVKDILNNNLQIFFVKIVNLMRDDVPFKRDTALSCLESEIGIQQLVPYFLQYIIGNMMIHFQNVSLLENLVTMTKSLVKNKALCSNIYTHSFLQIILSVLIGIDHTTAFHGDDTKLREHAAIVLGLILEKYESCYPEIRVAVFNALLKTLFDPDATLMTHFGALCGIEAVGRDAVNHVVSHLKYYVRYIATEVKCGVARQRACAQLVRDKANEIIADFEMNQNMNQ